MNGPDQVPAGWYVDQDMVDTQRYWNGTTWTDNIRPMIDSAIQPPPASPLQPSPDPVFVRKQAGKSGCAPVVVFGSLALGASLLIGLLTLGIFFARIEGDPSEVPGDDVLTAEAIPSATRGGSEIPFGQQVQVQQFNPISAGEDLWLAMVGQPVDMTASIQDDNPAITTPDGQRYMAFDIELALADSTDPTTTSAATFEVAIRGGATGQEYQWANNELCSQLGVGFLDRATFARADGLTGRVCMAVWEEDADHPGTQVVLRSTNQELVFTN